MCRCAAYRSTWTTRNISWFRQYTAQVGAARAARDRRNAEMSARGKIRRDNIKQGKGYIDTWPWPPCCPNLPSDEREICGKTTFQLRAALPDYSARSKRDRRRNRSDCLRLWLPSLDLSPTGSDPPESVRPVGDKCLRWFTPRTPVPVAYQHKSSHQQISLDV